MGYTFSDEELQASIERLGVLLPVVCFGGTIQDGRRRWRIAHARARACPRWEAPSLVEAAAAVWPSHPERALHMLRPTRGREAAELLGVRPAAVLAVERGRPASTSNHRRRREHVRIVRRVLAHLDQVEQGIEPLQLERLRELLMDRGDD